MEPDYKDIVSILKFLYQKIDEDGGDGSGIWLTQFYKLEDIINIIKTENIAPWNVELKDGKIYWSNCENTYEDFIIITNNELFFNIVDYCDLKLKLH